MIFVQAQVSENGRDMSTSDLLCGTNDSACLHYAYVAKLFIKKPNVYELARAQSDRKSDQEVLDVIHLDDRTLYVTDGDGAVLFVLAAYVYLKNHSPSSTLFPQPLSFLQALTPLYSPSAVRPCQKHLLQQSRKNCHSEFFWRLIWEI